MSHPIPYASNGTNGIFTDQWMAANFMVSIGKQETLPLLPDSRSFLDGHRGRKKLFQSRDSRSTFLNPLYFQYLWTALCPTCPKKMRPTAALWWDVLALASPLKEATCRGILLRRGRNFWPVPFSAPMTRPMPQDRGQDTRSGQPALWKKQFAVGS